MIAAQATAKYVRTSAQKAGLVLDLIHPDTGRTKYLLSPPVVGFLEFSMMRVNDGIPKKRMAEALEAYTHFDGTFVKA